MQHQGGAGTVLVSASSCHQAGSLVQLSLSLTSEAHVMWGQLGGSLDLCAVRVVHPTQRLLGAWDVAGRDWYRQCSLIRDAE